MDSATFLIQLVAILFSARLMGEVAARFGIPVVLGELTAGIILGPSLLNWMVPSHSIHLLAEIGIILLLFEVGLETDIGRLIKAGKKASIVALGGVILPFLGGYLVATYGFHLPPLLSLFIGCTLTATSIGITLRVLGEMKKQNSPESQVILGAAVIDDILGIIFLAMLYEFATEGAVSFLNASKMLFMMTLFFLFAPLVANFLSTRIQKWDAKSTIPGLLPTTIVSLILFFAWLAHLIDAPMLLGGFAAGIAFSPHFFLSKRDTHLFTARVEQEMHPIIQLFTPIFFVTIGLSLNLHEVNWSSAHFWTMTLSILLVAVLGKWGAGWLLPGETSHTKNLIGTAMVPRGEVGLIFAEVGRSTGVLTQETYASLILIIALTTLIAPFTLRRLYASGEIKKI